MIIRCETCRSAFRLDERRLRPEGSKVRCSVCGNIFTAHPPSPRKAERDEAKPDSRLDALFGDVFEESFKDLEPEPPPPEPSQDLRIPPRRETPPRPRREPLRGPLLEPLPPRRRRWGLILGIVGILVVLAVAALVGIGLFQPELIPEKWAGYLPFGPRAQSTDLGARHLTFDGVRGGFLDGAKAGRLFVIRGVVRNDYPEPRSYILIKANLLDAAGKVLKTKLAYAGNACGDEELKAMAPEEIAKAMEERTGREGLNEGVPPGKTIPFMVVFDNLPPQVTEFTVEPVSSSSRS